MPSADVAVIIPAKNEADRIGATVAAALDLTGVDIVVVVDDGSADDTSAVAAGAGAMVVRHGRNRGKAAAMESGAEAVRLIESAEQETTSGPRHLLFLDADLGESAAKAGDLAEPIRAGTADMTIAIFQNVVRLGGFGIVTSTAGAGIERATGWRPVQPLNGQRCLTRAAFTAATPLARGWGVETGMTIDLLRKGLRVAEVEVPLTHRATGKDWRSQLHRLRQLRDVTRAIAVRRLRGGTHAAQPLRMPATKADGSTGIGASGQADASSLTDG
jgi:hypothetical protein